MITVIASHPTRVETVLWLRDKNEVQQCVLIGGCISDDLCISSGLEELKDWLTIVGEEILVEITTDNDGLTVHDLQ